MQYMLLIYSPNPPPTAGLPREQQFAPWAAYTKALRDAGAMVAGDKLAAAYGAIEVRPIDGM